MRPSAPIVAAEIKGWCVYLLEDTNFVDRKEDGRGSRRYYVGMTNNLAARTKQHNNGECPSTRHTTWNIRAVASLHNRSQAAVLESWLKTGNSRQKRTDFATLFCSVHTERSPSQQLLLNKAALWHAQRQTASLLQTGNLFSKRQPSTEAKPSNA